MHAAHITAQLPAWHHDQWAYSTRMHMRFFIVHDHLPCCCPRAEWAKVSLLMPPGELEAVVHICSSYSVHIIDFKFSSHPFMQQHLLSTRLCHNCELSIYRIATVFNIQLVAAVTRCTSNTQNLQLRAVNVALLALWHSASTPCILAYVLHTLNSCVGISCRGRISVCCCCICFMELSCQVVNQSH